MCPSKPSWRRVRAAALAVFVTAVMSACGGGGGGSTEATTPPTPTQPAPVLLANVLPVTVDAGPPESGYNVNRLYTSVTLCRPGDPTQCQTIPHVLVDTGSTGLRVLASALGPSLNLSPIRGASGLPLLNCAQFVDNTFTWGPVVVADVVLGGKTARNVPVQLAGTAEFDPLSAACSSGTEMNTAATLGANGILGLGLSKEDCGTGCASVTGNGFYYTCTDAACTTAQPIRASLAQQVKQPVALFDTDNNGLVVNLPAVSLGGAASLTGSVIFGIATQANNQIGPEALLTTDSLGYITTVLSGRSLNTSFIDTGSNALFFDSGSIVLCGARASGFYCPTEPEALVATNVGVNGTRVTVPYAVGNAVTLFASYPFAVLPGLAGPMGDARTFDWGLPFFYGRRVFVGIQAQPSSLGTGPFYAF
jgi:hypothetical protein